jgi:hypothetical protein
MSKGGKGKGKGKGKGGLNFVTIMFRGCWLGVGREDLVT